MQLLTISNWLSEGRDFRTGIVLLQNISRNQLLVRNLSRRETRYSREKLESELRKYLNYSDSTDHRTAAGDSFGVGISSGSKNSELSTSAPGNPVKVSVDAAAEEGVTSAAPGGNELLASAPGNPVRSAVSEASGENSPSVAPGGNETLASVPGNPLGTALGAAPGEHNFAAAPPSIEFLVPAPRIDTSEEANESDDTVAVEQLEITLARMHNKKGLLSNSLRECSPHDNAGRRSILQQIDDLGSAMAEIRGKLLHFRQHGRLPPISARTELPEKPIPDDPFQLSRMLHNERSSRSKIKSRLHLLPANDPLRFELESRLRIVSDRIKTIEQRIHGSS
ncbi:P1/P2 acidic ribosomal protein [Chitinophaga rhizosphaerae]|uniref:hypothetical protein n=1 Tax=Chitinophaga rhizosphaerae TaxID=1864947 RepID=UPI000F80ED10|nr:hypothetical protein [Chitinophaga rhizosphaerae]